MKNLIAWSCNYIVASGYCATFAQQVFAYTAISKITGDVTAFNRFVGLTGHIVSHSRNIGIQNLCLERILILGVGRGHKLTELLRNIGVFDCSLFQQLRKSASDRVIQATQKNQLLGCWVIYGRGASFKLTL